MAVSEYMGEYLKGYLSAVIYALTVILAVLMIALFLPKRKKFYLRLALSILGILAVNCLFMLITYSIEDWRYDMSIHMTRFLLTFLLSGVMVWVCHSSNIWEALFCAVSGYCLQHIVGRTYSIFEDFILPPIGWGWGMVISIAINLSVFAVVYFAFIRRNRSLYRILVYSNMQLFIATCVVAVSIVYNTFGISWAGQTIYSAELMGVDSASGYHLLMFVYIMSIIVSVLCFMLSFASNYAKYFANEREILERMSVEKQRQYEADKNNMELLNMRLHDLKHYIGALDEKSFKEQKDEIIKNIQSYDSSFHTGNETLDILLTQKYLQCLQKGIRLSCMINGKHYDKISKYDLYALFTNAIDNAMESVENLPEEKRTISLSEQRTDTGWRVILENYFEGELLFYGGLPQTDKDRTLHGYGLKSMRILAEKYQASLHVETHEDIFSLNIDFVGE